MKKYLAIGMMLGAGLALLICGAILVLNGEGNKVSDLAIFPQPTIKTYPLRQYQIENLQKRKPMGSDFLFGEQVASVAAYEVRKFGYKSDGKNVSGLAHIPTSCDGINKCPVIVQSRGYIYPTQFVSGAGTAPSARKYAEAGFISLAPDFLGFGDSDPKAENIFESRFQTYTTVLDLLGLINEIEFLDPNKVGLWGHSNGGQITLTVLTVTGKPYPAVLWAPVTTRFPYSILYYSDEDDDGGKGLRKELARFESDYDSDLFWFGKYLESINGPIHLSVGGKDDLVPLKWGWTVVKSLRNLDKTVIYDEYPLADHNLKPDWDEVVAKNIEFYNKYFYDEVDNGLLNR